MNEIIKKLYNDNGKLINSIMCNKPYNHIAIHIEENIEQAKSINKYLHNNNIDSALIKDKKNNNYMYIRIYGNNDCDKFIKLIG